MSWYQQDGFEGAKQEKLRLESLRGPRRFWVKNGESKVLVTVDSTPLGISEHDFKSNGRWGNQFTCMKGVEDPCYGCGKLGAQTSVYTGYLTIVNCTPYMDKKGVKHQYEVQLCGGKMDSIERWKKKKDKYGMDCTRWTVSRSGEKQPSIGEDWEHDKVVDPEVVFKWANYQGKLLSDLWDKAEESAEEMQKLLKVFQAEKDPANDGKLLRKIVPFNYFEVLKPRGNAFIRDLLSGRSIEEAPAAGGAAGGATGAPDLAEENVPF